MPSYPFPSLPLPYLIPYHRALYLKFPINSHLLVFLQNRIRKKKRSKNVIFIPMPTHTIVNVYPASQHFFFLLEFEKEKQKAKTHPNHSIQFHLDLAISSIHFNSQKHTRAYESTIFSPSYTHIPIVFRFLLHSRIIRPQILLKITIHSIAQDGNKQK